MKDTRAFSDQVKTYLRQSGHNQKQLAEALSLNYKVVNRKLNGHAKAYFAPDEIKTTIATLANWRIITTREEVFSLLKIADLESTIFAPLDWQNPPLSLLTTQPVYQTSAVAVQISHNLLALTTKIIGRTWTVPHIQQLLLREDVRLVTLLGPGGSGKTRLALHVASQLLGNFPQGVWFISFSGISDPDLVPTTILQALDIRPLTNMNSLQSLITSLQKKNMLLVLDNFEHVAEAKVVVRTLLDAAADLKVLITSRIMLHLPGEHDFHVSPLDVPDLSLTLQPKEIGEYEAVQLFVERAQAVKPEFSLTNENAITIAQICARVDGLPLALELAAARIRVLPPALLLERLSNTRLRVLTGGARNLPDRQQTLSNTIAWSYNLLSPTEQQWFRRLGVFNLSWSLDAARNLIGGEGATDASATALLNQLVDNNLVVRLPEIGGLARFTMLETLREYALKQLDEEGELEQIHDWHACYYVNEAEMAELGLRGPQQRVWLTRLIADSDNFRAALEWSLLKAREGLYVNTRHFSGQQTAMQNKEVAGSNTLSQAGGFDSELPAVELCQRLASAFRPYWEWQGYLADGRYWLNAVLAVPPGAVAKPTVIAARAKALSEAARLVSLQNEQTQAAELADQSLALWRQLDDPRGLATALIHRGWAAHSSGDYETAKQGYLEGLRGLSPMEDMWLCAQLLFHLGAAAGFTSDFAQMHSCYTQSRELFELVGDKSSVADTLKDQGGLMILESKHREAITYLIQSLQLCYELDHKQFIATGMGSLSFAFGLLEEPDPITASIHSAQIRGASDKMMERIGLNPWTKTNPFIQVVEQYIRSRVSEQDWQRAWTEGQTLSLDQAIALATRLARELPSTSQA